MNTSKVYFTNLRTTPSSNLLDKMERLVKRAGIANIDFKNQFVAIKIHFGEPGNLAYIRPNYAARLVSLLRELGAKPFLTDCNTLYSGRRSNAVDHLQSAMENGFNPMSAGCNVIIGGNKLAETHPHEHLEGEDKFHLIHPDTNWQAGLRYAEEIGLGSQAYELITV